MPKKCNSPIRRFLRKAKPMPSGCVEWTCGRNLKRGGYGVFVIRHGKRILAHRYAYRAWKGEIPDGFKVCHSCDNPPCVNPDHLWLGTQANNIRDALNKGRLRPPPLNMELKLSEQHHQRRLSNDDVRAIKASLAAGMARRTIADRFGISANHVGQIARGERLAHVT